MMRLASTILIAASLVFAIGVPTVAQIQGGSVNGVVLSANHELLGKPLVGAGVEFWIPIEQGPFTFRFGGEMVHGLANRIGVPCAGLIQPGTCAPEPVRDRSQMTTVRGGFTLRLVDGRKSTVRLATDWMVTRVSVDTHGLASGRDLTAASMLWGPRLGLTADWKPISRAPVGLELEAGIGGLAAVPPQTRIEDGYTPFDGTVSVRYGRLGLAWRP